ncbi:MAG: hypothetical protein ACJA2S_001554 [Cyclobacteriaceae bacterium]|jgi:hypothetical protein
MKPYLFILSICVALVSCNKKPAEKAEEITEDEEMITYENYPAEGFDVDGSDFNAIVIADRVMKAMGGRKAWDDTRYISWNFFGSRKLLWDKWTGDVRVEYLKSDLNIIVNIHDLTGKVQKDGMEMTNVDSLKVYLDKGKRNWINDSYWLVMPYKLKDSGVTLSFLEEDSTLAGKKSYLLELTFKDVGVTPQNYYEVWVDEETNLVSQWAFYRIHGQIEANFVMPWQDYKQYGNILLSGDRGEKQLTDIKVLESVPEHTFKTFDSVAL